MLEMINMCYLNPRKYYYSTIKDVKLEAFIGTWMYLKTMILSEMNQTHTLKFLMVFHI